MSKCKDLTLKGFSSGVAGVPVPWSGPEGLRRRSRPRVGPDDYDIPYLHEGAITPDEAADRVFEGPAAGKFLITTHSQTLSQIRQKAADVDAYVDFLVGFRSTRSR
jgi:hypothetical protein